MAAAAGVGPSLALSATAVTLSFFSFFPTSYRGISELGLISGVGILIAFLGNITLLPALITLMPPRAAAKPLHVPAAASLENLVTRHARALCIGAIILGIAALATLPGLRFDANPINLKDPSTESVRTLHDLTGGGVGALTISIVAADADRAVALAQRLKALPLVDKVVTVRNLVPADQDAKLAIIDDMALFLAPLAAATPKPAPTDADRRASIAAFQRAVASRAASDPVSAAFKRINTALDRFLAGPGRTEIGLRDLEQNLIGSLPARLADLRLALQAKAVTLENLPADLRSEYLAADGRARVEVYPKESLDDPAALARFVAAVRTVAPDAAGDPVMLLGASDAVIDAFRQASLTALVLTVILLWFQLRNVADVALVLAPLALASLLTCAVSALIGPSLNFANIIVLPLLLGLGVATGIYLVTRAREEGGGSFMQTITPRAVLFSALTTLASFGSLAVSGHRGTASMGILLTIALLLTLACMLIVLPAMRAWLRPRPR
jgi:hopanoid biosynthesis associated RND transporter like protein HpnN